MDNDPLARRTKRVTFSLQPVVGSIEQFGGLGIGKLVIESFASSEIPAAILEEASKLFSENYGIWGKDSERPGKPVKLNGHRLRAQWMPESATTFYTRVTVDGQLAGNAFSCRWACDGKKICWITQLVVSRDYRERGLAGTLLTTLRREDDDIYGIISSHPAACLAATKSFGTNIEKVSLEFIREHAATVMRSSPIPYVRDAELSGVLFDPGALEGIVSGVNTHFLVDHQEPLKRNWPSLTLRRALGDGRDWQCPRIRSP
ncbi:hypothetical protein CONLIGDRAFT_622386 [Coniochaeta ligniaria NRRL 30616]|uniref:N-acetyltransferase domain-containing protein n=1 Tax=Coniochaeta ligniaria NRRL 30616 TaxID=1408157 RepID=A0A1J7JBK6_9PEZI|nr:hypothetical protein CONLIGDRAFT_622386 [Coniochaeta ligniaria NRRL 30616]